MVEFALDANEEMKGDKPDSIVIAMHANMKLEMTGI